jgi:hypothetical protein
MRLMNTQKMTSAFICAALLSVSGCASLKNSDLNNPQAPLAEQYPLSYQKQIQASKHWAIIADDLADQLQGQISEKKIADRPVFINLYSDQTEFSRAFNDFLITSLVNRGVTVSKLKNGSTIFNYKIQTVEYKSNRSTQLPSQAKWTVLATGLVVFRVLDQIIKDDDASILGAGVLADVWTSDIAPKLEIIITTSILSGNVYVSRRSDIYYANSTDIHLYDSAENNKKSRVFDDPFYQSR